MEHAVCFSLKPAVFSLFLTSLAIHVVITCFSHVPEPNNFANKMTQIFEKTKGICLFEEENLNLQVHFKAVCHASYWVIWSIEQRRIVDYAKDDGEELLTAPRCIALFNRIVIEP